MIVLPSPTSFEQTLQKAFVTTCDDALRRDTQQRMHRAAADPRKKGACTTQGLYVQTAH
ncbi:hypothetical protein [Burkholderia sp. Ac-20365]|jgi:hypothetical protein|uniref:hypothetical protein n=1 Tax=Burkholderia sp. Ac-20365 TaxID=2703897 RepID=UPI00197C961A|nr:hypothetical protein [Burkholderia sp. Ac-20365]MBN3762388.1 hypothetical protein [Burkholderia sp. Ac-20365]